jgi:hypothetical protein
VRGLLPTLALLLAVPCVAQAGLWEKKPRVPGLRYGGRAFTQVAPDLRMSGPYEDRLAWRNGLDFNVRYQFADVATFAVGARFRYTIRSGDRVEADFWLNLDDTWLQIRKAPVTVRMGMQQLRWGSNTLLSPLNVLNPLDYTAGLSSGDASEGLMPSLAVKATVAIPSGFLELVYLPFFQPLRVAWYGRDFAVLRPGMLEELLPTLVPGTGVGVVDDRLDGLADRIVDAIVNLDPYQRDGLQSYLVADLPEEMPWNGDVGFRGRWTGPGIDLGGYVLWHILDQPAVTIHPDLVAFLLDERFPDTGEITRLTNPGAELVSTEYHRSVLGGLDAVAAVGGFVFSLEGAVQSHTVHYTRQLEPYLSPSVHYAVAVRWNQGTAAALDVEFGHDIILRPRPQTFLHRPHNLQVGVGATGRLWNERVRLTVTGSFNLLQRDLYLNPEVGFAAAPGLELSFGAQIFEGFRPDVAPTLDSFLSYGGGIPGYFRGNDYGYGKLELRF